MTTFAAPQCAAEALIQAKKLLSFHAEGDERAKISGFRGKWLCLQRWLPHAAHLLSFWQRMCAHGARGARTCKSLTMQLTPHLIHRAVTSAKFKEI